MLLFKIFLIIAFSGPFHLFGEEPFVVKLETESKLAPLYLLPIDETASKLAETHVAQVEKILCFDLNHNGSTIVAKRTLENNLLGKGDAFEQLGNAVDWKRRNIFYVVKTQIQGNSLKTLVLDVNGGSIKSIDPIQLTEDLSQDRKAIHRLSDIIHKALFGIEGIASTHILYSIKEAKSADSRQWTQEIFEADYDGGNPRQLTFERSICINPVYLPPKPGFVSPAFLFVSYKLGQPKIYLAGLKDGKKRPISSIRGNQLMPAIARQRDKIAFICDITGNPDLFLQPFNTEKGALGKPQQIFSARLATQGTPTFSPDGSKIAFVSNKDGSAKIYVMPIPKAGANIKDIQPTLISRANRENSAPAWSPDGTKIAYCARTQEDRQIWIYDFNTGEETKITTGKGHKENPTWAPNSLHLAFNTSSPQSSELFIINLNQLEAVQMTFGPGEKRFPNWEPRF